MPKAVRHTCISGFIKALEVLLTRCHMCIRRKKLPPPIFQDPKLIKPKNGLWRRATEENRSNGFYNAVCRSVEVLRRCIKDATLVRHIAKAYRDWNPKFTVLGMRSIASNTNQFNTKPPRYEYN